jgi:RNA ligase
MKLNEYIDITSLNDLVEAGMINEIPHPTTNLVMYNYSKECQTVACWNDTTKKCRGLIVDIFGDIVARPMAKFFNYEEYMQSETLDMIPTNESFEVYEKLDGSLGILYWIGDKPFITTKGSFVSEQGAHATHLLHTTYKDVWNRLDRSLTYMFEIIYPDDPHIVRYDGLDDIFLIAIQDTNNPSNVISLDGYSDIFNVVRKYDNVEDWSKVRENIDGTNREGFVIKFESGFRLKLKYEEYAQLHYMKHHLTPKRILDYTIEGKLGELEEIWQKFDEESRIYYDGIVHKLNTMFEEVYDEMDAEHREDFPTRKEAAAYYMTCKFPHQHFARAFGNPKTLDVLIWKEVRKRLRDEDKIQ